MNLSSKPFRIRVL